MFKLTDFSDGDRVRLTPGFYQQINVHRKNKIPKDTILEVRLIGRIYLWVGLPGSTLHWKTTPDKVLRKM